jgi:hypothetical protein
MTSSTELKTDIEKAEAPYKDKLEQIAIKMIKKLYPIIDELGIVLDAKIVGMSDVGRELNEAISPEFRRRIMNAVTQGAATRAAFESLKSPFLFYLFKEYLKELDPSLIEKYNQIMKNSFGIYDDENAIAMMLAALSQGYKMAGGASKVSIKEANSGVTIKARAINFPILVHELAKGFWELIC